jgi:L-rhamnose mutarotase
MIIKVRPEKLEEYKKLHASIWPEVLDLLKKANIDNISIYLKDDYLFEYLEYSGADFEADISILMANPVYKKWLKVCEACQQPLDTREKGEWWARMEEVFHCDYIGEQ